MVRAYVAHAVTCPSLHMNYALTAVMYWGCTAYARFFICMCFTMHVVSVHQQQTSTDSALHLHVLQTKYVHVVQSLHLHMQHSDICIQQVASCMGTTAKRRYLSHEPGNKLIRLQQLSSHGALRQIPDHVIGHLDSLGAAHHPHNVHRAGAGALTLYEQVLYHDDAGKHAGISLQPWAHDTG